MSMTQERLEQREVRDLDEAIPGQSWVESFVVPVATASYSAAGSIAQLPRREPVRDNGTPTVEDLELLRGRVVAPDAVSGHGIRCAGRSHDSNPDRAQASVAKGLFS